MFKDELYSIINEVNSLEYNDIQKLIIQMNSSVVIQYLIQLSPKKIRNDFIKSIIIADDDNKPPIYDWIKDIYGSHVLECIVEYCDDDIFQHIFNGFCKNQLLELANNNIGNHFIQKVLINCRTSKQTSRCSHELRPNVKELLENKPGVIVSLLDISRKYSIKMDKIYYDVLNIVKPTESDNVLHDILYYNSKHV